MREKILEFMENKTYRPMTLEDLAIALNENEKELLFELEKLEADYIIKRTKKKKYDLMSRFNLFVGKINIKEKGYGFIRSDEFTTEFYVPKELIGDSMDSDTVLFTITDNNADAGFKKEAAVVEVIARNLQEVIGQVVLGKKNKKKFRPNDKSIDLTFEVTDFGISVPGDVVVFEIDTYVNAKLVRGRIIKILGNINDVGIDIKSIAYKYGFESEFSEDVTRELKNLNIDYEREYARRRKVKGNIITIDGADAKDLDDAVAITRLANGNYLLGVYIADVSFFVMEGLPIDKSAFERGTSVYLTDRVIPMLPHKLSNDLCSLNPHTNKLVIGCEMEIDQNGKVVNHDIFEGVISTKYRMTYHDVNLILEDSDDVLINKYKDIYEDLLNMKALAEILNRMRNNRGSLDFEIPEGKIIVDENGTPIDVVRIERGLGERIIEEFMLIANETVAETITHLGLPFIYRVHDNPNELKLNKFIKVARLLGYKITVPQNGIHPHDLQKVLYSIEDEHEGLKTLLLRMMAKAKYSPKNIGHYGLASSCYTHFTAPIRRYPDIIVHRLLRKYLFKHEVSVEDQERELIKITRAAEQSSARERAAIDCEYEVEDYKKAEYMENFIGEEFDAKITSVTNFGLFAALDNTIEGLIHISDIEGYFVFDENSMALVSKNESFRIGDQIKIRVKRASKETRQIDFELVRGERSGKRYKGRRKK